MWTRLGTFTLRNEISGTYLGQNNQNISSSFDKYWQTKIDLENNKKMLIVGLNACALLKKLCKRFPFSHGWYILLGNMIKHWRQLLPSLMNLLYHVSDPFVLFSINISALIYLINNYEIKMLQRYIPLNTHIFSRFKFHFKYMRMAIMQGTDFTVHKPHPLQAHACVLQRVVA